MTASATLDGGPVATTERAFPCLDGARILAATVILIMHVGSYAGVDSAGVVGRALYHLEVGVAVFFVLSGFLLFRPFAAAAVARRPAPSPGAYLWRRALRILPAYWITVAAALLLLDANAGADGTTWFRHLALVMTYDDQFYAAGLLHAWSLCVEVSFYAVLPLLALGLITVSRGRADRPWPGLLVLAGLAVAGPLYLYLAWLWWDGSAPTYTWLPAFAGWFAAGMALAFLTVADPTWRPVQVARGMAANLGACWTVALALYVVACSPLTGPVGLIVPTPAEATLKNVLNMGVAFFLVLPLVLAEPDRGPVRRALASRPMRHLGEISYGVFLLHVPVLVGLYESLGAVVPSGSVWLMAPVVWGGSVAMASVLYVLVERPISRWRSLVPDRSLTAVSAGYGGAAGSRSFELAMGGHTEQLVAALDSGTPVDLANDHGDTLLILAADHSRADTVAALLARGADHSRTNDRGQTALSVAVYRRSAETVGHLLAAGGDPDAGTPSARATASHFDLSGMRTLLEAAKAS